MEESGTIRSEQVVPRWGVWQETLNSTGTYADPVRDVQVTVRFTAPDGVTRSVEAYWDGGNSWGVRFCPDREGDWRWETTCGNAADEGLHGVRGTFRCTEYLGDAPLCRHGVVGLSADCRSLAHADGTPFFWLGDTAWNGALLSDDAEWEKYLTNRVANGFTVVQFVCTTWRSAASDREGQVPFTGREAITIQPGFFQRLDRKAAAVNAHGLLAAPVMLWSIAGDTNPGYYLPEEDAILLARYMVARYGAYHVSWILAGDGDYRGEKADRWRRIGRAVFGDRHDRLVTMHPAGQHWVADEFRNEEWYDFVSYQSGHGDGDRALRWHIQGPPANDWRKDPPRPFINQEPNYEQHRGYERKTPISPLAVRRAAHWSLLLSPTAGVTYGHHSIWPWNECRRVPEDHPGSGEADAWYDALDAPGAQAMGVLRRFFESLPWWRLCPYQDLVAEQPGDADPAHFVAAGATPERDTVVVYVPEGPTVRLRLGLLPGPVRATWHDPRTGDRVSVGTLAVDGDSTLDLPGGEDWVLLLQRAE